MGEPDTCPECQGDGVLGINEMLQYATVSCTGTTITIQCEDLDVKEALFDWLTGINSVKNDAEAIKEAVVFVLHNDDRERDYPIYEVADDRGLEEYEYINFATDVITAIQTNEKFVNHHPENNSVSLDPNAGLSRDQLKKKCRVLSRALNDWQFAAMSAAQDNGNDLENVREPYRTKIREMIEAYSDGDDEK
jgi:hypothetical protein